MGSKESTWLVTLAPVGVMLSVWMVQIFYYEIWGATIFNPVSITTWGVVAAGMFGYAMSAGICSVLTPSIQERPVVYISSSFIYFKNICFVFACVVILKDLLLPVLYGASVSELRNQVLDEWVAGGIWPRINAILLNGLCCFIILIISLMYEAKKRLSFFWILLFACLCVACFSRTLLLIGMSIILLRVLLQARNPIRMILFALISFVCLFLVLAWLMKDKSPGNEAVTDVLVHHLQIYFFGGVSGLNYFVEMDAPKYNSLLTVPRFLQVILPTGFDLPPSFFDFVETPGTLNVFTSMFPPYHDFGVLGVLSFFVLYGAVSTIACVKFVKTNKAIWQVIAGFFLYATTMTIFDDQFLRGLPVILILIFFAWIFDKIRAKCLDVTPSIG